MRDLRQCACPSVCRAVVVVVCAGTLAACGSASGTRLTATESAHLRAALAATRTSADRGDGAGALAHLRTFDREVRALAANGRLAAADARALRAGTRQARAAVARSLQAATPTATPTPTSTPAVTPPPTAAPPAAPPRAKPHKPHKPPKGKHGKGHG